MRDVATLAGVSFKTVARVVHGEQWVRPTTAARVQEAIRQLGYQPNEIASSLKRGVSRDTIDDRAGPLKPIPTASVPTAASSVGTLQAKGTRPMPTPITLIAIGISRASPIRFTARPTSMPCTSARVAPMNAKRYPIVAVVNPNRRSLPRRRPRWPS